MKILVIGGYGFFGGLLVTNLLIYHRHDVIVAGRSLQKAERFCRNFDESYQSRTYPYQIDIHSDNLATQFRSLDIDIVVNACGPYQLQRHQQHCYRVAKACIEAECHYIDLADDREFVVNFASTLNQRAQRAGVMCVSGASTVPGLTGAVLDHFQPEFSQLTEVRHGISPGNRARKSLATVASILSYAGRPFDILYRGSKRTVFGWQQLRRYNFGPPLGKRWFANCQIPDLDLLPARYPSLRTVWFQAGLEIPFLHCGLWLLSFLPRIGLIENLTRAASWMTRIGNYFLQWGSDNGGMFIQMRGIDHHNESKVINWQLVAEQGTGPNVPTMAAEILIDKIASGYVDPGAGPCLGLFSLGEFFLIASRWGIYQRYREGTEDVLRELLL